MGLTETVRFLNSLLKETGVPHVYVGGIAVSARGEPRATKDADVVLVLSEDAVDPFLDEIERRGLKISRRPDVARKLREGKPAKILWDKKYSFDLRLAGFTIDGQALARAEPYRSEKFGDTLLAASAEDLIVYKIARFDDIDRRDIRSIVETQESVDWPYIREQAEILAREINKPEILMNLAAVVRLRS